MLYLQWPQDGTDLLSQPHRGGLYQAREETPGDGADVVFNQLRMMGWGLWGGGRCKNSHFLRKESCVYAAAWATKPSTQLISENVSLLPIIPKFPREREGREENFMVSWLQLISGLVSFYFQGLRPMEGFPIQSEAHLHVVRRGTFTGLRSFC